MARKPKRNRANNNKNKKNIRQINDGFKRKKRSADYDRDDMNQLLRLVVDRKCDDSGRLPKMRTVWRQFLELRTDIYIPYNTMTNLVKKGYDGKKKQAPKHGRPCKLTDPVEEELADQVWY
jgi:hypothetical protein